jgi:hypothetical protein
MHPPLPEPGSHLFLNLPLSLYHTATCTYNIYALIPICIAPGTSACICTCTPIYISVSCTCSCTWTPLTSAPTCNWPAILKRLASQPVGLELKGTLPWSHLWGPSATFLSQQFFKFCFKDNFDVCAALLKGHCVTVLYLLLCIKCFWVLSSSFATKRGKMQKGVKKD